MIVRSSRFQFLEKRETSLPRRLYPEVQTIVRLRPDRSQDETHLSDCRNESLPDICRGQTFERNP